MYRRTNNPYVATAESTRAHLAYNLTVVLLVIAAFTVVP
jgi:hypothetical protein